MHALSLERRQPPDFLTRSGFGVHTWKHSLETYNNLVPPHDFMTLTPLPTNQPEETRINIKTHDIFYRRGQLRIKGYHTKSSFVCNFDIRHRGDFVHDDDDGSGKRIILVKFRVLSWS